jgi:hypothetical protein
MTSINKTSISPLEPSDPNRLDEPLIPPVADDSQDLLQQKKDIILKFSESKPHVDNTKLKDNDSNYMVTETCTRPQLSELWFDDVSPTSSNNMLSDDENTVVDGKKSPENLFTTILHTVNISFFLEGSIFFL